jgi:MFS family permease
LGNGRGESRIVWHFYLTAMTTLVAKRVSGNLWKLNVLAALRSAVFFVPVLVPFLTEVGLSFKEIMLVEGAFSLTMVLMEIPSGYFADIYGRKRSVVLGSIFFLISMLIFCFADSFIWFFVAEIFGGLGISFRSGANEALLYDSLIEMGEEQTYKKRQGELFFYERMSGVFGFLFGGVLAMAFLRLPVYVSLLPGSAAVFLTLFLQEPSRHEMAFETWGHFKRILSESFFENAKLRWFILYAAFPSGISLAVFWLYQSYMELVGLPIFLFGVMLSVMNLFGGFSAKFAHKLDKWFSLRGILILLPVGFLVSWLPFVIFQSIWLLPMMFLSSAVWGLSNPIFSDYVQKSVSSDRRATMMSVLSLFGRALFVASGPFLGWFADLYDVQVAILMAVGFLVLTSLASFVMLRRVGVV